jgi:hypothetical protein
MIFLLFPSLGQTAASAETGAEKWACSLACRRWSGRMLDACSLSNGGESTEQRALRQAVAHFAEDEIPDPLAAVAQEAQHPGIDEIRQENAVAG